MELFNVTHHEHIPQLMAAQRHLQWPQNILKTHLAVNSSKVSSACSLRRGTEVLKEFAAETETRAAIRGIAAGRTAEARKKVAEPRAATRSKEAECILERIGEVCW